MSARKRQLQRVAAVRALQERIAGAAKANAVAAVREARQTVAAMELARLKALTSGAAALTQGDRGEWMLADSMREVAAWQRKRLEGELAACEAAAVDRDAELRAARVRLEQVEAMEKRARVMADREQDRSAQAQGDDRFAARMRWDAVQIRLETS